MDLNTSLALILHTLPGSMVLGLGRPLRVLTGLIPKQRCLLGLFLKNRWYVSSFYVSSTYQTPFFSISLQTWAWPSNLAQLIPISTPSSQQPWKLIGFGSISTRTPSTLDVIPKISPQCRTSKRKYHFPSAKAYRS